MDEQIVGAGGAIAVGLGFAFLYSGGKMTNLGTLPGGISSAAYSINNAGQVVGASSYADSFGGVHGFLYSGGKMVDLMGPATATGPFTYIQSVAYGINSSGQVVGKVEVGSYYQAFLYSGGSMTNIGALGGSPTGYNASQANGINDLGQIVGWSYTASGKIHAFLYSNGKMADLGTLPGGSVSQANAINNSGQIVGWSDAADGNIHAFLYSGGSMIDLGTILATGAYGDASSFFPQSIWGIGISDAGQIVGGDGFSLTANGGAVGNEFLDSGGVETDLSNTAKLPSGVYIAYANGINNLGQIAANETDSHAYLLTPLIFITTTSLPNAISGESYSTTLAATGGQRRRLYVVAFIGVAARRLRVVAWRRTQHDGQSPGGAASIHLRREGEALRFHRAHQVLKVPVQNRGIPDRVRQCRQHVLLDELAPLHQRLAHHVSALQH